MHNLNARQFIIAAAGLMRRRTINRKFEVLTILENDPVAHEHEKTAAIGAAAKDSLAPNKKKRWRRPLRMTPKAQRRRWFKRHQLRMRAMALKKLRENYEATTDPKMGR